MNEKIKQLAEQAELLGPSSRVGNSHEATEKFAELIVRECSDIIKHRAETSADYFDDIKVNDHARQVQRDCAQTLRLSFGLETFGVEE
jgi:hypothetical protein